MSTATAEPPVTAPVIEPAPSASELSTLTTAGDTFAANLASRTSKKEAKPVADPPETKIESGAKTTEPVSDKKAKDTTPGKTPLDVAPAAKKEPATEDPDIEKLLAAEPPKGASAAAIASHAEMRKGLGRADALIKKLTAERDELKTKAPVAPSDFEDRLKAAEEAVKEREARLERVAFEQSPKFQNFVKSSEAEVASAKSYIEGSEIDPNVIELAARNTGATRLKILTEAGMDPAAIAAVTSHLARADAFNRDRESAQENWKTTHAEWTAEQQKSAEAKAAQVKANEDKVFTSVRQTLSDKYEPFTSVEDNPAWTESLAQRDQLASEIFSGKHPLDKTSEIIHKGVAFDVLYDSWKDRGDRLTDSMAENERIKAARPGAPDGSSDSSRTEITSDPMKLAASTFEANRASRGL